MKDQEPKPTRSPSRSRARRQFLVSAALGSAQLALISSPLKALSPGLFASGMPLPSASKKTVVVVYLRGGADALNIVVPWGDKNYSRYRPGIGILTKPAKAQDSVWKLDDKFGLHPALSDLKAAWSKKQLAPIVCTGSPHPTRSHFDAQDFMEYAAPGMRTVKEGWLNRYLSLAANKQGDRRLRGLTMQRLLPRSLRGRYPVLAVPTRRQREIDDVLDVFDDLYGGAPSSSMEGGKRRKDDSGGAVAVGQETIAALRELFEVLEKKGDLAGSKKLPRYSLASKLLRVARVIKADAGLEVVAIDTGGWDTHTNQGGAVGNMSRKLKDVGSGLATFAKELGDEKMKDVLVLVMSEFGRTCLENGNKGTDHGHGSCMLALGGTVDGGKVHGKWPGLDSKKLYQGRDLQVTTDFREIFRQTLENHLGQALPKGFFPGFKVPRRGISLFV
ncbi:MAG: DUF1501 domain-containing protein [Planctomycetota bacterium]